jgi:branched-chain amino acid transport system permease protein
MAEFFATYGNLIISMVLAAVLALSLYLPLMAGQLSLASPGFYALGGYIAAVLSTGKFFQWQGDLFPVPLLLLEMLIAGVASAGLAFLVGVPALRLRGIYLALATIAFVEVLRVLSLNLDITGGAVGIFGIPQPFHEQLEYLWVAAPLLLLSMAFVYRLERIRVGRAFVALREDELAADAMGINPTYYKVLAFVMGAVLAGVTGAVMAHFLNTWNARQGTFDFSITILAFVLIGGSRTFLGPVLGAMALTALPEILRALSDTGGLPPWLGQFMKDGRLIIYGFLIVVGAVFLPQGLITPGLFDRPGRGTNPTPTRAEPVESAP